MENSRSRGPQEKVKPFPGVGCSPQTNGSRDATRLVRSCEERREEMIVSVPKLTGHAMQHRRPGAQAGSWVVCSFSPQTNGSRDATQLNKNLH